LQNPIPPNPVVPSIPASILRYALLGVGLLLTYGFIGSIVIMRLDPVNALYFAVITTATVGYGDISPSNPLQKLFVVTLVLGGASLLAYAFTLAIAVVSMTFEDITSGARERRRIASLNNHFILCGYGRVGSAVYRELKKRNQQALIIERDKNVVEKELWVDPEVMAIHGDATEESLMYQARVEDARGVIITTGDDVDNLFITFTARELNSEVWIVARASKEENIKRLSRSGADKVISPETSGASDIYFAAIEPTIMKITVMHDVSDIRKESGIILKHGCTLENIEYHLPEFKEPLARTVGLSDPERLERFLKSLERDKSRKKSLEKIYESVNGIHSHWISGPDKHSLEKVAKELKNEGILLGIDLNEEEIKEKARKYGRLVEVVIKPEIKITEMHGVSDIKEEAEIILNHRCTMEDIEYYLPGFREPLTRKINLSEMDEMDRFLDGLQHDSVKKENLERLYTLSGGGIHSHRVSGPDTKTLGLVEKKLKEKGFLLGVNFSKDEITDKIQKFGRVSEMLLKHDVGQIDDKKIIIRLGGRILDSKHYLPGVHQVVTRKLYLKSMEDLERCEKEYQKPDAKRSLQVLDEISRHIHSHTVSAPDLKVIKDIEKALIKEGILLGVDVPENDVWKFVESAEA
jgi:voltage-gated potassium channel